MALAGFKFTVLLGWISGLIFTSNPLNFRSFQTWKSLYTVYAFLAGLAAIVFNLDYRINIFPSLVQKAASHGDFAYSLLQGFVLAHVALVGLLRIYFFARAKGISELLKNVMGRGKLGHAVKHRSTVTVISVLTVLHIVLYATSTHLFDRKSSWFRSMGDGFYMTLAFFCYGLHCFVPPVAFSLISVILAGLVGTFEDFCDALEHALGPSHDGELPPTKIAWQRNQHLQQKLLNIFGLFDKFDVLIGPPIFLTILLSSVAVVQVLNEVWNVGYGLHTNLVDSLPWANLLQHAVCLMLLDAGYEAGLKIDERKKRLKHMKMHAEFNATPELELVVQSVTKWRWRMTAAGFFKVDRSLITGIISTMMTYFVILFQLQNQKID